MRQAIQISDDVTNIIALQCVRQVNNYETIPNEYACHKDAERYTETYLIYTLTNGQTARRGDWLVQHDRGSWNVYTDDEYKKATERT